jgi:hypothetical protein
MQVQEAERGVVPDVLSPRRPDDEEFTHNPGFHGQATNKSEARKCLSAVDQVSASVRILEEAAQATLFLEPFFVWHRAAELRQVMTVQLPQPLRCMPLLARAYEP